MTTPHNMASGARRVPSMAARAATTPQTVAKSPLATAGTTRATSTQPDRWRRNEAALALRGTRDISHSPPALVA